MFLTQCSRFLPRLQRLSLSPRWQVTQNVLRSRSAIQLVCQQSRIKVSRMNPLHVQKGFKAEESVVTLLSGWSLLNYAAYKPHPHHEIMRRLLTTSHGLVTRIITHLAWNREFQEGRNTTFSALSDFVVVIQVDVDRLLGFREHRFHLLRYAFHELFMMLLFFHGCTSL